MELELELLEQEINYLLKSLDQNPLNLSGHAKLGKLKREYIVLLDFVQDEQLKGLE